MNWTLKSAGKFDPKVAFSAEPADAQGLVAVGGNLEPETLLAGYRAGVFPWYDDEMPICWWSPDPRAIIELDGLHVSHRLARTIRSKKFETSFNRDFRTVMMECSARDEGSWITLEMLTAYVKLHKLGHAHSLEVWHEGELAGGIYGVAVGGFFAGESMFHRVNDASKVALAALVDHLSGRGFKLFDIQFVTPHTVRMGAIEIPRSRYLQRLHDAIAAPATFVAP